MAVPRRCCRRCTSLAVAASAASAATAAGAAAPGTRAASSQPPVSRFPACSGSPCDYTLPLARLFYKVRPSGLPCRSAAAGIDRLPPVLHGGAAAEHAPLRCHRLAPCPLRPLQITRIPDPATIPAWAATLPKPRTPRAANGAAAAAAKKAAQGANGAGVGAVTPRRTNGAEDGVTPRRTPRRRVAAAAAKSE